MGNLDYKHTGPPHKGTTKNAKQAAKNEAALELVCLLEARGDLTLSNI